MTTNQTLETSIEAEATAPAVPVELTFEYQPTDENDLPIGGKQVIKYTDPAELPFLLAKQNTLLVRKLREQQRKLRLGIVENDTIDDGAQRLPKSIELKSKTLTPEQRAQLSRDILDEDTFDKAITTVFETAIGVSADEFRKDYNELREDNQNLKAIREVEVFQAKNPDYIVCDENAHALVNWLVRYNLALTAANFQLAFNTLKEAGVLITTLSRVQNPSYVAAVLPVEETIVENLDGVREEIPGLENEVIEPITIVEDHPALHEQAPVLPAAKPVSRVPLSLNRNTSSGNEAPIAASVGDQLVYKFVHPTTKQETVYTGQKALDAMPSDEYKRRMKVPGFLALAQKIEAETETKRRARG